MEGTYLRARNCRTRTAARSAVVTTLVTGRPTGSASLDAQALRLAGHGRRFARTGGPGGVRWYAVPVRHEAQAGGNRCDEHVPPSLPDHRGVRPRGDRRTVSPHARRRVPGLPRGCREGAATRRGDDAPGRPVERRRRRPPVRARAPARRARRPRRHPGRPARPPVGRAAAREAAQLGDLARAADAPDPDPGEADLLREDPHTNRAARDALGAIETS